MVYWGNKFGDSIGRGNNDGNGTPKATFVPAVNNPGAVAATSPGWIAADQSIYWQDYATGAVSQIDIDGTGPVTTVVAGSAGPRKGSGGGVALLPPLPPPPPRPCVELLEYLSTIRETGRPALTTLQQSEIKAELTNCYAQGQLTENHYEQGLNDRHTAGKAPAKRSARNARTYFPLRSISSIR